MTCTKSDGGKGPISVLSLKCREIFWLMSLEAARKRLHATEGGKNSFAPCQSDMLEKFIFDPNSGTWFYPEQNLSLQLGT